MKLINLGTAQDHNGVVYNLIEYGNRQQFITYDKVLVEAIDTDNLKTIELSTDNTITKVVNYVVTQLKRKRVKCRKILASSDIYRKGIYLKAQLVPTNNIGWLPQ